MKHAEVRQKLSAYLDGAVTPSEKQIIEEHLTSCHSCRTALDELAKTVKHVKSLGEIEPSPWLTEKIMARVKQEAVGKPGIVRRLFFPLQVKLPIEAMALVLVSITGYLVYRSVQPEMRLSGPPAKEEYAVEMPARAARTKKPQAKPDQEMHLTAREATKKTPAKAFEQKPARIENEKKAPQPSAKGEEALSLRAKAMPHMERAMETARREDALSAPVPRAERNMWPEGIAAEKKDAEERFLSGSAKSLSPREEAHLSLALYTGDVASAATRVESEVSRLAGRVVRRKALVNRLIITVEMPAKGVASLLSRIKQLGDLRGAGTALGDSEKEDMVTVSLEIIQDTQK